MKQDWLYQPETRRKLWIAGIIILALAVVAEMFIDMHSYFSIADFFGFNVVYGFLSGVVLIVIARVFSVLLKRKDDYYDR